MDKDYYRAYFDYERNHWWFRARSEILKSYIENNIRFTSHQIANIGVATGSSSVMLRQFGNVSSLEYEQDCINYIKDKIDFEIIQGSILELPYPDQTFDLACAFDVIEHVHDDSQGVRELMRICRPGGSVLITVPAHMYLWSKHDKINHHFRRYTKQHLEKIFLPNPDGEIIYCSYFNSFLYPLIFLIRQLNNFFTLRRSAYKTLKSDFEKFNTGLFNSLLFHIMHAEKSVISKQNKFPNGVSLILHWKKHK